MKMLILFFILGGCYETGTGENEVFIEDTSASSRSENREVAEDRGETDNGDDQSEEASKVSFEQINKAVLTPFKCIRCHGDWATSEAGLRTKLVAGDPAISKLFKRVQDETMPMGGNGIGTENVDLIERYILDLAPISEPEPEVEVEDEVQEVAKVTFEQINKAVLTPFKCIRCHGDWATSEAGLKTKLVAGDPSISKLFNRVQDETMPLGGNGIGVENIDLIERYILELAP